MNTRSKVVIAVGIVIVLVGIALLVYAGPTANPSDSNPEEYAIWRGTSADNEVLDLEPETHYQVYVKRGGEVENLSITNSTGTELFAPMNVIETGLFGEPEWHRIGDVALIVEFDRHPIDCPCSMNLTSDAEVIIVDSTPKFGNNSDDWCLYSTLGCMILIAGLVTTAGGGGWALLSKKGSAVQMQTMQQQAFPQQVVAQQVVPEQSGFPPDQQSP